MAYNRTLLAFGAAAFLTGFSIPSQAAADQEVVGLEAQGVDPWAALRNRGRLDVRDALNRPVSARRIEAQLKAASAASIAQASASRLPRARMATLALELLSVARAFFSRGSPFWPAQSASALPALLRCASKVYFAVILFFALSLLAGPLAAQSRARALLPASCRPLVLRC